MPVLEFRHGDPAPEVWGAMLFPDDSSKREAYIGGCRTGYFPSYFGDSEPEILVDVMRQANWKHRPDRADVTDRFKQGLIAGELLKVVFAVAATDKPRATWRTAIKLLSPIVDRRERTIRYAKERFMPVIHFWGAWALRDRKFHEDQAAGYQLSDDLHVFLAESMAFLQWGRRQAREANKAEPIIPEATKSWVVPPSWDPPTGGSAWPRDGRLFQVALAPELQRRIRTKPLQSKMHR